MAKTTSWTGNASTDPDAVANWDNGVPVSTDSALVPASGRRPLIPTSSWTAIALALLDVQPGFRFDVGGSGNPLIVAATDLLYRGDGTLYFEGSPANSTETIIINSDKIGPQAAVLTGASVGRVLVNKGHTILTDLNTLVRLEISYRTNRLTDAVVDGTFGPGGGGAALTLIMAGGQFFSDTFYATVDMSDGVLTYASSSGLTTLNLSGGTLKYNGAGTLASANLLGGTLDFSANPNEVTITDLWKLRDATLVRSELLTVTNEHDTTGGD